MTVVIIHFSSPHHLYLHHLAPIPGLHIRIYEINTHTRTWIRIIIWTDTEKANVQEMHTDAHSNTTNIHIHTRLPSCHRAKPLSVSYTPIENVLDFCCYVVFPLMWVCVSLCLMCSLASRGDRSWRRPSDWAVTNPLTTRLTIVGHDHTEGDGFSRW